MTVLVPIITRRQFRVFKIIISFLCLILGSKSTVNTILILYSQIHAILTRWLQLDKFPSWLCEETPRCNIFHICCINAIYFIECYTYKCNIFDIVLNKSCAGVCWPAPMIYCNRRWLLSRKSFSIYTWWISVSFIFFIQIKLLSEYHIQFGV